MMVLAATPQSAFATHGGIHCTASIHGEWEWDGSTGLGSHLYSASTACSGPVGFTMTSLQLDASSNGPGGSSIATHQSCHEDINPPCRFVWTGDVINGFMWGTWNLRSVHGLYAPPGHQWRVPLPQNCVYSPDTEFRAIVCTHQITKLIAPNMSRAQGWSGDWFVDVETQPA